ncbi:terpene cyclase/mutase family protein [Kiritimatiellota bacterium B12222]|nr:terpene cyclase/mutase family protein [Kiritimatiellota bacterium B12222]
MNPDSHFIPPPLEPTISEDFQAGVFQKIRKRNQRFQNMQKVAILALFASSLFIWRQKQMPAIREIPVDPSMRVASAAQGVEWLVEQQQADGAWSASKWGGHDRFSDGVSALATLALLNSPEPIRRESLDRAVSALESRLKAQSIQLEQGPQFYNYILTLYTLSEIQKQMPDPARQSLLQQSYATLIRLQQASGGWGYPDEAPMGYSSETEANTAVTWWVAQLLSERPSLRLPQAEASLSRAQYWLSQQQLANGDVKYQSGGKQIAGPEDALYWMMTRNENSPQLAQNDAYRDLFRLSDLKESDLYQDLWAQQQADGAWRNQQDRWWQAGGQVYLTALSVLTQVPGGV